LGQTVDGSRPSHAMDQRHLRSNNERIANFGGEKCLKEPCT
jgi:hypothetical protein